MGKAGRILRAVEMPRSLARRAFRIALFLALLASLLARGDTETIEIDVDGLDRTALVHVPEGVAPGERLPLILAFHGSALNGRTMEEITGFSDLADREGFVVVYPNGSGPSGVLSWNAGSCCSFALERNIDDLAFVDALLDTLIERYPVDTTRIYATGFSNGGMLTYALAIETPERFAAIAVVSGAMFASQGPADEPLPVLIIHGTDDAVIPYVGGWGALRTLSGKTEPALPAAEAAAFWIAKNGCKDVAISTTSERNAQIRRYSGCRDDTDVVFITLLEGPHGWPVIADNPDTFLLSEDAVSIFSGMTDGEIPWDLFEIGLDATQTIWEFFEAHGRR